MREIRPAVFADVDGVALVEEAARREGEVSRWLPDAIADPERIVLVAVEQDRVLAWAKTHRYGEPDGPAPAGHYLGGVTVHPEHRREGLGAELTVLRCRWLARRTDIVHCVVSTSNSASLALHAALGFTEVARAPSFHGLTFASGSGALLIRTLAGASPPLPPRTAGPSPATPPARRAWTGR